MVDECQLLLLAAVVSTSVALHSGSAVCMSKIVASKFFKILMRRERNCTILEFYMINFPLEGSFCSFEHTPSWSNFRTANRLSNMLSSVWRKNWCPIEVLHKKIWVSSLWICFYRGKTLSSVLLGQKGHTAHEDWQGLHSSDSPQCKFLISGTIVYAI